MSEELEIMDLCFAIVHNLGRAHIFAPTILISNPSPTCKKLINAVKYSIKITQPQIINRNIKTILRGEIFD